MACRPHCWPSFRHSIRRSLRLIDHDLRSNREVGRWFFEILTSPRTVERILRQMNESGVLGRFVPEFGKIVARLDLLAAVSAEKYRRAVVSYVQNLLGGSLLQFLPVRAVTQ